MTHEKKLRIFPKKLPNIESCETPSPPDCIKIPTQILYCGRRGSGKSYSCWNLLTHLKSMGLLTRLFVISPTARARTNLDLWQSLDADEEDVTEDTSVDSLRRVIDECEAAGREYRRYEELVKKHAELQMWLRKKCDISAIPAELLVYADSHPEIWEKVLDPQLEVKRPVYHVVLDDVLGLPLMRSTLLVNLATRHRHIGSGCGLSVHITAQSYTSNVGGVPRCVRNNITVLVFFKSYNDKEIEKVIEECAELPPEQFRRMYDLATSEPHRPLCIEISPKREELRYRASWNTLLLPDAADAAESLQQKTSESENDE
jgi:Cdc6-like AAA superfamily ATPase